MYVNPTKTRENMFCVDQCSYILVFICVPVMIELLLIHISFLSYLKLLLYEFKTRFGKSNTGCCCSEMFLKDACMSFFGNIDINDQSYRNRYKV